MTKTKPAAPYTRAQCERALKQGKFDQVLSREHGSTFWEASAARLITVAHYPKQDKFVISRYVESQDRIIDWCV